MIGKNNKYVKKAFACLCSLSLIVSAAAAMSGPAAHATSQATYYVDPVNGLDTNDGTSTSTAFQTIGHARDVVRTINSSMTDDIEVQLRGGTYTLASTLNFTDADSGTNGHNIIYKAYNGENPVISGGKSITGWTLYDASKNIYSANAGDIETRQLFVNGNRAIRAKSTGTPSPLSFVKATGYTATGSVYADSPIPMHNWGNLSDIEFVYKNEWTAPRVGVSSISNNVITTTITMKQPAWGWATNKGLTSVGGSYNSNGLPWYVENAYELLDAEGEWYMNRATDTIYYKPRNGENLTTATVIAPILDELVRVQGSDLDHKAHNLQFKGITFNYTTDVEANSDKGHVDSQNDITTDTNYEYDASGNLIAFPIIISAAVNLKYANAIQFERDVFEHLGNTGLNMYAGSQDNLVIGSRFSDISGNGIEVGDYKGWNTAGSENYGNSTDSRVMLRNNDVSNNYFTNIGAEYYSSTAIAATFPQDMDVLHNEIANVSYSGIHIGYGHNLLPSNIHKNTNIQYNYVHEVTTVLSDGGGIYVLGYTDGDSSNIGTIANNYLLNQYHDTGSLYTDNYSDWWNVTNNVVINTPRYFMSNSATNVTVTNTYTNTSSITTNGGGVAVSGTTVVTDGNWPAAAQTIMNNAGLESAYQNIKSTILPATTKLYENFDWMNGGSPPSGWTINNAGGDGTVTVDDSSYAVDQNKSMKLTKTSATSGLDIASSHGLAPLYSGTAEVKASAGQSNALVVPIALKSGAISAVEIAFNSNGQIAYKNSSGSWSDIQAYTPGTWYSFKVEFDTVTGTYNLYIDGVQQLSNAGFASASGPIDTVAHQIKAAYTGTAKVDNVNLYEGYTARQVVSLNKTITGFSSQLTTSNWKAANINDGVVNSTYRGWASVSGSGTRDEWIKIDLGQLNRVSSFTIQNEDAGNNRNVKDYVLYGSSTGAFAGEEYVISSGTIPALLAMDTYSVYFTPVDTRYIKFKGTSSYSSYVIVGELSVYGLPTPPSVVSLNKTVTGYSSQYVTSAWKAANINDGVVNSTYRGWASASGTGTRNEWVNLDLGQLYTLSSFTIQNEDAGDNRNVKDYVLYGSTTGAFTGEEFVISSGTLPSLNHLDTYTVNFTPVDARFIRFKGTSSYSNYVIVGELSVYGLPAPPAVVSLNKTVTGYSSQINTTDWKAANINDGTVSSTSQGWASVSGSGTRNEWVKFDLGQNYTLSYFTIQAENSLNNRNVKDYVLYGSTTGAFTGEEFVISSGTIPSLSAQGSYTVNFTPVDARYVKFKGTSSYSSYVIVGELSLYGIPAPPSVLPNVSLNKTVTGYSSQYDASSCKAANINDGVVNSTYRGWCSAYGSGTRNEWVKIDLAQSYRVSSLTIQNEASSNNSNVKDYVLYGSVTGAFAGEEYVISSGTIPPLNALDSYTVNFTPVDARYVKFKGTSSYSNYVIVGELSLFGQ